VIHLFCGYDERESVGWAVFAHSVIARASKPVALVPLTSMGLAEGTNAFTKSRFLVPYLMGFKGHAIFMDGSDMLMLGDVAALEAQFDPAFAVQVVQHPDYETRHPMKYVGTGMESTNRNYPRKNWASVMLVNCEHPSWSGMTPDHLAGLPMSYLLGLEFCGDAIGSLRPEWNRLVDEGHPQGEVLHWTAGIPAFPRYSDAPGAERWFAERGAMLGSSAILGPTQPKGHGDEDYAGFDGAGRSWCGAWADLPAIP
jgi:hypothetical protein